ncbi:hypothetical protein B0T19DRAFT_437743 [Cercophora scortea]|uniref:Uncharacterized protein n=1 Tax=Cercophora scortea TaxID=314031 RepID=A0AAE0J5R9_9PEZI|nr:hypothetical protein B0T19DRAFT_437743 [Cercophora scortea]
MGFGIGGVGVTEEQTAVSGSRWSFSGHLGRSKGSPWDNKLQWHLDENVQEAQPMHSNVIHTAFALEHNASMFYMTVEVTGRLQDTSDRIINKLRFGGKKDSVTTKIHWKEPYSSRLWLDKIARDLPLAMEYENMSKVPVEVPDASSAEFRPSNHPSSSASADSQQALGQENGGAWMTPEIPADTHASLLGRGDTLHLPELTLENMCMAAGLPVPDASSSTAGRPGTTHQATRPSKAVTRGYADDGNTARFLPLGLTKWESLSFDRVLGDADVMLLVQWLGKCSVAIFAFVAGLFGLPLYTWACSWYAESPRGFEVKEDQSSLGRKGMNGLPSEKDLLDQDELDGDTLVPPSRGTPSLVASGLGTQGWGSESKKSRKSLVVNWDPATRDIPSYEHQSTGNDRRAMYAPRPPPGRSATTKPPAILKKSGLLPDIDEMCAEDISPVPVVKRGLRDGDVAVPGRDPRGVEGNNIGEGGGDGDLDFSTNKSEEIGD